MRNFLLTTLMLLALPAHAGEAEIRQAIKARFPSIRVNGVQPTPMPGLFEVRFQTREGPQLMYSDALGNFLFVDGQLIDAKSGRNLTEERMQKLTGIDFGSLPLDLAVKVQRGNGKRVVAVFSDPYCPYCRRLEQALLQIDDLTVYVFMYPVIRPDRIEHSRAVWCAPDRARAWLDLAASDTPKVPSNGANCADPVDKVLELGRTLRVTGTPTLFFANGERASGTMEVGKLREKMDELARAPASSSRKN